MNQERNCRGRPGTLIRRSPIRFGVQLLALLVALAGLAVSPAAAQQLVTGRVTAAVGGEPLPGVQVAVQGTSTRTVTDVEGRYSIAAPSTSSILVFSRTGYATQTAAASRAELNVQLAVQAIQLEGMVVVGYGEKNRPTITESIGTVSQEQIQRVTVASPDAAIQGRVPGVQVTTESGTPGAPVAMRIRGVGTVGNTQPLFVVDGVPVGTGTGANHSPLATINPNDIESISVLKDASAASVYGMQAANGVVLIQTRRGRMGKPTIRYDAYTGIQQMPERYDLLGTADWFALQQEAIAANNAYFNRQPTAADYVQLPVQLREGSPERALLLARNTDWARVGINDNAPIQSHNLSISGANEQVNYFVSGGYFAQDAIVDKWDLTRYSFRANSDFVISPRLRVGETFTVSDQVTLRGAANYGDGTILGNLLLQAPIYVAYDSSLVSPTNPRGLSGNFNTATGWNRYNMNSTNQLVDVTDRTTRVLGGVYGELEVLPGLSLRSQNSVDYGIGNLYYWQGQFTNPETGFERVPVGEDQRQESYALVSTNTATYTGARGNHAFDVLAGVETNRYRYNSLSLQTTGFVSSEYELRRIVALGDQLLKKSGFAGEENRLGYIGRLNYNFADRYLFTATVRRDGVSTFAPGNQWGTFPAFSAGWRISEEPFFNVGWIDELKLRGSWGQLGNSAIPGGQYPQYVSVQLWAEYQIGNQVQLAPTPQGRLANPNLTWETNETRDIGFESSLFGNRLDLTATWYRRDTKDFLVNVPVPVGSGFSQAPINVGSMRNTGWELEAAYRTQVRGALDLQLSANVTTVKNELVSLLPELDVFQQGGFYRTAVGFPVGYFYGYRTCGIHQTDAAAALVPDRTTGANQPRAGDLCIRDIEGRNAEGELTGQPDGQINTDDRTYLGKTIPDAYYGINLNANWRRLDLTAFFNGVVGVQRYNAVRRDLESMSGGGVNQLATTLDRWSPSNPGGTLPRAILGDPAQNNRFSDRWVEDGDFFRLKTLQLGYSLPDDVLGSRTRNTRVYVSATNLFTLTDYSGLDPEFGAAGTNTAYGNFYAVNGSQLQAGTDFGNIPQPRMFQVGVSTSF